MNVRKQRPRLLRKHRSKVKTLRLQETSAERISILCTRENGATYCIDTKRCSTMTVPDDVVKAVVTPIGLSDPCHITFANKVEFAVV
jgi:hypothetical protein